MTDSPPLHATTRCPSCGTAVAAADMFCRHCGKRFQPGTTWYYQPIWILVLGLFVMGPLVLPLVWKSPAMSRNMKLAVGAGIAIYTALLVYFTWLVVAAVYGQIQVLLQEVEMM